jgi:translation initiation factor RLI1
MAWVCVSVPAVLYDRITYICLELNHILDRDVNLLSGGELQRFAIGTVCVQQADVYVAHVLQ